MGKEVFYICDGQDKCSDLPICFRLHGPELKEDPMPDLLCDRTKNPEHARYGTCADPENYPERFVPVPGIGSDVWYEIEPDDENDF